MAAARPILAHAAGDVADVVTNSSAGMCASPGDIAGTAEAIRRMATLPSSVLAGMGRRGRKHYEEHFSLPIGLDRIEEMVNPHTATARSRTDTP